MCVGIGRMPGLHIKLNRIICWVTAQLAGLDLSLRCIERQIPPDVLLMSSVADQLAWNVRHDLRGPETHKLRNGCVRDL